MPQVIGMQVHHETRKLAWVSHTFGCEILAVAGDNNQLACSGDCGSGRAGPVEPAGIGAADEGGATVKADGHSGSSIVQGEGDGTDGGGICHCQDIVQVADGIVADDSGAFTSTSGSGQAGNAGRECKSRRGKDQNDQDNEEPFG